MQKSPIVGIFGNISDEEKVPISNRLGKTLTIKFYPKMSNIFEIYAKDKLHIIITIGDVTSFSELNQLGYYYLSKHINCANSLELQKITENKLLMYYLMLPKSETEPLISISTTSYKSGHKIQRPYRSLLSQTYKNWEWVIYDDSPHGSENFEMLRDMASRDSRIRIYKSSDNTACIGEGKFNACRLSKGEIFAEVDHDDDLTPDCLELLRQAYVQYPDAIFYSTDFCELHEATLAPHRYGEGFCFGYGSYHRFKYNGVVMNVARTANLNPKTIRNIIGVPNHIRAWKSSFYLENSHNWYMPVADDYELLVRTWLSGQMVKIPKFAYLQYRNIEGNTTFIRNDEITKLQKASSLYHDSDITNRCNELELDDERKNEKYDLFWQRDHMHQEHYNNIVMRDDIVSVVIPTFLRPQSLKKAIDSVLNQTFQQFEIIVIGDGCTEFESVLLQYNDSRLKWWNHERNYCDNGSTPRNYALMTMTIGKHIAYLNDNEIFEPDYLESRMKLFENNSDIKAIVNNVENPQTSKLIHTYDLVDAHNKYEFNGYWLHSKSTTPGLHRHPTKDLLKRWIGSDVKILSN